MVAPLRGGFKIGITVDKSKARHYYDYGTGKIIPDKLTQLVENNNPIDILDRIDIKTIERYLRNKKLDNLEK